MKKKIQNIFDRICRDKSGKLVIIQMPNLPLAAWLVATVLTHILPYGQANFAANLIAFGAIFTWAWMEIFMGSAPIRRVLGVVVLVLSVTSRL
jgi:hypothetical protein